ncbi:MAG TPA: Holliday junction resolvase RuvX [Gemmatimonadales bacterium]|nr:Holliday junction resolvase RuvX [Gemmatimonadales bacterium]
MSGASADRPIRGSADRQPGDPATPLPRAGRLLCVDPGAKRIGLAVSDPTQTVAQPLATLARRAGRRFPLAALRPFLEAHAVVGVVVGLPVEPSGREGPAALAARQAGTLVSQRTGLPVTFVDERMSTARARRAASGATRRERPTAEAVDQMAAAVILQTFLDRRRA